MRDRCLVAGLLLAATCFPAATTLHAQTVRSGQRASEAGRPFITNFSPSDYDADTQNWAMVEDHRGVLYVGNNSGLLEYDGSSWRLILLPNLSTVRSLALDTDGRVWVGAVGDIGYLDADSLGRASFVSLAGEVPEAHRGFADVWQTHVLDGKVYFLTSTAVYRWDGSEMVAILPQTSFHIASVVAGEFYARQWGIGFMRLDRTAAGDSFHLVPGGERFASTRIYVLLPFDSERILVGSREEGLFLFDGRSFEPFATEADQLLADGGIYLPGAVVPGGQFALGTLSQGLVVIDRAGRLAEHVDRQTGLLGESVLFPFVDRTGTLWLGLDAGIARVETGSPFTHYGPPDGLPGRLAWLERHDGRLYGTTSGGQVLILEPEATRFRTLDSPLSEANQMRSIDGDLLVAGSNEGLWRVVGDGLEGVRIPVSYDYLVTTIHPWRRDPGVVIAGLSDGVGLLRRSGTGWIDEGRIPGLAIDAWSIAESEDGTLWIGSESGRLARIRLPEADGSAEVRLEEAQIRMYDAADGLPGSTVRAYRVGPDIFVTAFGETVFRVDPESGDLVADHTFDAARTGHPLAKFALREDAAGNVWIAATFGAPVVARPRADGGYVIEGGTLQRLRHDRITDVFPESNGIVWFLGEELIRYDASLDMQAGEAGLPLVRRVRVGEDRLVFDGFGDARIGEVPFGSAGVHFEYSAPGAVASSRFRTRLDGLEPDWSTWTTGTERAYTNLSPGDYTFRVEAEGRGEASYALTVLPPWYRTWWAYIVWVAVLGALVYGVDRLQRIRLVRKERERSALLEAELRADAADANAKALKAENERKQNVELLSRIGQTITSSLSVGEIIDTVYEHVNRLMDAEIFGVGILNEAEKRIDFPATKEKGVTLEPYFNRLGDSNRLGVWCFTHGREVVIGDFVQEHAKYLDAYEPPISGEDPESVLYLPLVHQERAIGVITTQSFKKQAYTDYHVNLLRNLATYTAIALDNASAYRTLEKTVTQLQSTQKQLVEQEKLASLGSLTAGIAHEIKNPLNFVNNFAEVNAELADELVEAIARGDEGETATLIADLRDNASQIAKHGKRADSIVRSMMLHARGGASERETIDVNAFIEEYAALAWHGLRARDDSFRAELARDLAPDTGSLVVMPQELGRVILNLLNNAFQAVQEKAGREGGSYAPAVTISTRRTETGVSISVSDNGPGIPPEIREKIFEPFFTTKATGEGTGLGLSLSYDIVTKGHGGTLTVENGPGGGAEFRVVLPA